MRHIENILALVHLKGLIAFILHLEDLTKGAVDIHPQVHHFLLPRTVFENMIIYISAFVILLIFYNSQNDILWPSHLLLDFRLSNI